MNHDDHEHEAHEAVVGSSGIWPDSKHRMRLRGPLSREAEAAMRCTIGCALAVHRALGAGFLEALYKRAMCLEFNAQGLAYERERRIKVSYRGVEIPGQRVDFIVQGSIVVELKAVIRLDDVHRAQLISYLKTTGLRGGLLINFRVPLLRQGIRRVVL